MKNLTRVQRTLFMNSTLLSSNGIWLTGFEQVHWFAYIVPGALMFAALSVYCIGQDISKLVLKLFDVALKQPRKV